MKALKRFIEKKKSDSKFTSAGEGRKLTDERKIATQTDGKPSTSQYVKPQGPSAVRAGAAALARFETEAKKQTSQPKSKTAIWKTGNPERDAPVPTKSITAVTETANLDTYSPYPVEFDFQCPFCHQPVNGSCILNHMKDCLLKDMENEPTVAAVLMIHCLNLNSTKRLQCIEYLTKYLTNIIENPDEVKYQKIKRSNKIFKERVEPLIGVAEFLTKACGFIDKDINVDDETVPYFVIDNMTEETIERMQAMLEMLREAEPLQPELARSAKAFLANSKIPQCAFDSGFYKLTSQEVKQQQLQKTREIESSKQLKTKAMRDAQQIGHQKDYKYSMIRVKFPDGTLLQGAFKSSETLSSVAEFIQDCTIHDWVSFKLSVMGGETLDVTKTLTNLHLVPSAMLLYSVDKDIERNLKEAAQSNSMSSYIKKELMIDNCE